MRFRFVLLTISTERSQQSSQPQRSWKRQNRLSRHFRDGNVTSVESRTMRIFRRTAENTSSSSRRKSVIRSPWFPTDLEETISFTEINKQIQASVCEINDKTAPEDFRRRVLYEKKCDRNVLPEHIAVKERFFVREL